MSARRRAPVRCVLAAAALALAACRRGDRSASADSARAAAAPVAPAIDSTPRNVPGQPPIRPDSVLTPGATLPVTAADICVPGYSRRVRDVPSAVKREAYARYGIRSHRPGDYEVDHLVSLELGGSNSIRNLWPESFHTRPWNARVKDALENELHRRICDGTIDLATAQRAIATNWIAAYWRYVGPTPTDAPAPRRRRRR